MHAIVRSHKGLSPKVSSVLHEAASLINLFRVAHSMQMATLPNIISTRTHSARASPLSVHVLLSAESYLSSDKWQGQGHQSWMPSSQRRLLLDLISQTQPTRKTPSMFNLLQQQRSTTATMREVTTYQLYATKSIVTLSRSCSFAIL